VADYRDFIKEEIEFYREVVKYARKTTKLKKAKKELKFWNLVQEGKLQEASNLMGIVW
jgi:hypothetical protein